MKKIAARWLPETFWKMWKENPKLSYDEVYDKYMKEEGNSLFSDDNSG